MKTFLIIAVTFLCTSAVFSQYGREGNVRIIQDPEIEQLVRKHIKVNETLQGIPGYRVQIFFDSGSKSKIRATDARDKFRMRYPEIDVYLSFISPNYKVRAGDFRTSLDAFRFLKRIQSRYPNAYVVSDQIKLPAIN